MADETGDGAGSPEPSSTPGAEPVSPESTYTFSWPTVDPADTPGSAAAPAASAPSTDAPHRAGDDDAHRHQDGEEAAEVLAPPRRRRTRAVAVAAAVVAALGVGGTALAVNGRSPEPSATGTPAPDRSQTPTPAPSATLVARGLLTSLDDVLAALVAQIDASGTLWTQTDGQVTDPATRERLRVALDAASTWLTAAWEPRNAADARGLAAVGQAHLETIDALTAAVQQDHDAWVAARSGPVTDDRDGPGDGPPGAGTPPRASGSSGGSGTDPGTGGTGPETSSPGTTDPPTSPTTPDPGTPTGPDPDPTTPTAPEPTTPSAPDPGGESPPPAPDTGSVTGSDAGPATP